MYLLTKYNSLPLHLKIKHTLPKYFKYLGEANAMGKYASYNKCMWPWYEIYYLLSYLLKMLNIRSQCRHE